MRALALAALSLSVSSTAHAAGPTVELGDLTTSERRTRLVSCPVALIYNGGMDETGPHVALAKHNLRAQHYGTEIAERLGNAPNPKPSSDRFVPQPTLRSMKMSRVA